MHVADIWTKSLAPDLLDLSIMGFYLMLIFLVSHFIKKRNIEKNPAYAFYVYGLFASIAGALALCVVYSTYYPGGDTTGYYRSSEAMVNLLFADPQSYFRILLGDMSPETMSAFTPQTGSPWYRHDVESFAIVRITSIFTLLGFKNFFTASILFAWFFYLGYWKIYLLFCHFYKKYYKQLAVAILFFPSVIFWGSGILKDTVTISLLGWFLYSIYFLIIQKNNVFKNILTIAISLYFLVMIKPYILTALMPALMIWAGWYYITRIDNVLLKYFVAPFVIVIFVFIGIFGISLLRESLGVYGSLEGIIQKAIITYEDHIRFEQYGERFYDLGHFDGTLSNFFSKTPNAVIAALYRPFLWEVSTPLMFFSAIENLLLLAFTLFVILRRGILNFLRTASREPLVVFALTFAFIFAFAVGISSANFGALVRLKIPMVPFFVASFVIIFMKGREEAEEAEDEEA